MSAELVEPSLAVEGSPVKKQEIDPKSRGSESQSMSVKFSKLSTSMDSSSQLEESVLMILSSEDADLEQRSTKREGEHGVVVKSEEPDSVPFVDSEPPFKKNRRVQVPSSGEFEEEHYLRPLDIYT